MKKVKKILLLLLSLLFVINIFVGCDSSGSSSNPAPGTDPGTGPGTGGPGSGTIGDPVVKFSYPSGTYWGNITVELFVESDPSAVIYYTRNWPFQYDLFGERKLYDKNNPIQVIATSLYSEVAEIEAAVKKADGTFTAVSKARFVVDPVVEEFDVPLWHGKYGTDQQAIVRTDDQNCEVYYTFTTDDSIPADPTKADKLYTGPIDLTAAADEEKIYRYAFKAFTTAQNPVLTKSATESLVVRRRWVIDKKCPGAPINLIAKASGSKAIKIDWESPGDYDVKEYEIVYGKGSTAADAIINVGKTPDLTKTVSSLIYDTKYSFIVYTYDDVGNRSKAGSFVSEFAKRGFEPGNTDEKVLLSWHSGEMEDDVIANGYAYVIDRSDQLMVLNLTDQKRPYKLKTNLIDAAVTSVDIDKNYLYAVCDTKLNLYDITDPGKPLLKHSAIESTRFNGVRSVTTTSEHLIVENQARDLFIMTLYDGVTQPQIISEIKVNKTYNVKYLVSGKDIAVIDLDTNVIKLYSMTNLTAPPKEGKFLIDALDIVGFKQNYFYVRGTGLPTNVFEVYDINNPTVPVSTLSGPCDMYNHVAFDENYLYVVNDPQMDFTTLTIYSLATPANPKLVGEWNNIIPDLFAKENLSLSKDGNTLLLYQEGTGAYIIDVTRKTNPVLKSPIGVTGFTQAIARNGNYLYMSSQTSRGFRYIDICDITDRKNPKYTGAFCEVDVVNESLWKGFVDLAIANNHIYGATEYKLFIGKINADASITRVNYIETIKAEKLNVYGNYLIVTTRKGSSMDINKVEVYSLVIPDKPKLVSTITADAAVNFKIDNSIVEGSKLYLKDENNHLYVYDISIPETPVRLAKFSEGADMFNDPFKVVACNNDYLYLFASRSVPGGPGYMIREGYVNIYKIISPLNLKLENSVVLNKTGLLPGVLKFGRKGYAYIMFGSFTYTATDIQVLNMNDPLNPYFFDKYEFKHNYDFANQIWLDDVLYGFEGKLTVVYYNFK